MIVNVHFTMMDVCIFFKLHVHANYKKGAESDKVYQLLAHGRWFSSGTSASSTTKTGSCLPIRTNYSVV